MGLLEPAMSMLAVLFLIGSVSSQCLTGDDSPAMSHPGSEVKKSLRAARMKFALQSLKETSAIQPDENIFYSPHSLYEALSLAYFGSRGTTEQSLKKALHIPDNLSKVDVERYYTLESAVAPGSQNVTDYDYASANRLWISDKRKIRECMLDVFGDQLEKTDFHTNPDAVRDKINQWVSDKTKRHIRDLLPPNSIGEDTDLVLVNAVYFKGLWRSQFDPANSRRDPFYTSGSRNSMVTYMYKNGTFNHLVSELLGAHILELPYKGDRISMFVMLPPFAIARSANGGGRDGVKALIDHLTTDEGSAELRDIFEYGAPDRKVEVFLPRFTVEKQLPMGSLLQALGAGDLMGPNSADLRGFVAEGERPLHLGDAVHRARIEVTEEGTTAAAATALFTFRSGRPLQPAVFNANHPFVYMLYDRKTKAILFAGVYRSPSVQRNTAEASA